jgi:hypothetical protein
MINTIHDLPQSTRVERERDYGGFNDFPPNWREMSEAEFAKSDFFTYSTALVEFRQMLDPERKNPALGAHLNWQTDLKTGYAIVNDFWAGKIKFYHFGCDHKWGSVDVESAKARGITLEPYLNARQCTKCGQIWQYDSSD